MHSTFFYAETREGRREQEKAKPAHYSQARHLRQVCAPSPLNKHWSMRNRPEGSI
jgi:hypothetical protein